MMPGYIKELGDKLEITSYLWPNVIVWTRHEKSYLDPSNTKEVWCSWKKMNYTILQNGNFRSDDYVPFRVKIRHKKKEPISKIEIDKEEIEKIFRKVYNKSKVIRRSHLEDFVLSDDIEITYNGPYFGCHPDFGGEYEIQAIFKTKRILGDVLRDAEILMKMTLTISKYQALKIFGIEK